MSDENRDAVGEVRHHLERMSRDGTWVGEDVVAATAHYLRRDLYVYSAVGKSSPLIYQPKDDVVAKEQPLQLAFYEPGHYSAVAQTTAPAPSPFYEAVTAKGSSVRSSGAVTVTASSLSGEPAFSTSSSSTKSSVTSAGGVNGPALNQ
jgi:hypothetical protein